MIKYNKNLPVWYRITPIDEDGNEYPVKMVASLIGAEHHLRKNNTNKGTIESVQKVNGEYVEVSGKAKAIIYGIIELRD